MLHMYFKNMKKKSQDISMKRPFSLLGFNARLKYMTMEIWHIDQTLKVPEDNVVKLCDIFRVTSE